MKVLSSLLVLSVLLCGCSDEPRSSERATTVVVPPSSGTTTVVIPHDTGRVVLCRDGTRPPCY